MSELKNVEFQVRDYDLALTLDSGQTFRWTETPVGWEGVISGRWIRLRQVSPQLIRASLSDADDDWSWLKDYLQLDFPYHEMLENFPADPHLSRAIEACSGLRLLRQDPWETLASFICSSTKQIVQIRQIVELLSRRLGGPVQSVQGNSFSFPSVEQVATAPLSLLLECKLGFRARYLKETAEMILGDKIDLKNLGELSTEEAREKLMQFPGVGRKVADCVLLFGYGFQDAFPIDVWIIKALQRLYFPRRKKNLIQLQRFSARHFGPHAGYAQQFLFHYMRVVASV